MVRRSFSEILRAGGVDAGVEYGSLQELVFERYGLYSLMDRSFRDVWFAGTAISLDDFNERYGFDFEGLAVDMSVDDLLEFCEYVYNFAGALYNQDQDVCAAAMSHVNKLVDKLGHVALVDDGLTVFVPKNANVMAAAEVAPGEIVIDLMRYDYRKYDGDLAEKRVILLRLIDQLEPKRKRIGELSKKTEGDIFFIANNLNLRHNNVDPQDVRKFKPAVQEMSDAELERWYDHCRDLCAAAFLLLGCDDRRTELDELKSRL